MSGDIDLELDALERQFKAQDSKAQTAEQGSIDWLMERVGKATGSEFSEVMAKLKEKKAAEDDPTKPKRKKKKVIEPKPHKESARRYNYRMELVVERLTGEPSERYVSKYMQWGIEQEPAARLAYEARTGAMVMQPGFRHHPTIPMCGGSVDGLVDDDGIIEIKCPTTFTHIETILHGMDDEHKPQTQGYLWITGRKWCDFVSYDPRLPAGLQLYVQRVKRDDDYIAELAGNVIQFLSEVDAMHKKLLKIAGPRAIQASGEPDAPADPAFDVATQP